MKLQKEAQQIAYHKQAYFFGYFTSVVSAHAMTIRQNLVIYKDYYLLCHCSLFFFFAGLFHTQ